MNLYTQNITSGIAGILSTFPADKRPTAALKDAIGTDVDVNKPFGMSLLFTAIYAGETSVDGMMNVITDGLTRMLLSIGAALVTFGSGLNIQGNAETTLLYM